MTAGRELDALIAEKIMRLNVVSRDWPCGPDPECGCYEASSDREVGEADVPPWHSEKGPVYVRNQYELDGETMRNLEPVPFYSTQIQHAWKVVENFSSRGVSCFVKAYSKQYAVSADGYTCTLLTADQRVQEGADTAAEAICKAAIRWLEDCTDA